MHTPFTVSFAEEPLAPQVESVCGLGAAEHWGRWNSDSRISIRFAAELPPAFEAHFACAVTSANIGRAITLVAGGCCRRMVCATTLKGGLRMAKVRFRLSGVARTLEILIPGVEPGTVTDPRPLGLALSTLSIIPSSSGKLPEATTNG